ncbi:hypothetical protein NST62_01410 [Ureibacillus sp. FSL K6-8385]|uniref:Uncharacterized protein n=1 Tax=Ureibacillus terrenus TaxID=118246 RepID=A0A540V281_9BACL|nr:hypothetical protein [Ureibacillus terrenus]MED3661327.1 hypothetical protein [Ureibacillus terrenus]MED3764201.1 hypothetical protein [Ureibacillus terrenus]TQE90846.1 hypothetical protein FKZ59_07510 [Ureibacillus terrenus]
MQPELGIYIGIIVSAILSFVIAGLFHQPLHWYLFILILFIGFLLQTIIMILQAPDEQHHHEHK